VDFEGRSAWTQPVWVHPPGRAEAGT
jgi:hypothetical protein